MSRAAPKGSRRDFGWHAKSPGADQLIIDGEEQRLRIVALTTALSEVQHDDPGVYFITTADGLFTKIGWVKCAQWADLRRDQLQIGNPVTLRLELVVTPSSIAQERKLHRHFAALRASGEWFRREGELKAILDVPAPDAIFKFRAIIDAD